MRGLLEKFLSAFCSLKLTIVCLAFSMALVLFGTLDQVHIGIRGAQKIYFESWWVVWNIWGVSVPTLPGGMTVGAVLFANLLAMYLFRFQWTRKKAGIHLIHSGILLLLLGGFVTQFFQTDSQMVIEEGGTAIFVQDLHHYELAVVMTSGEDDAVVGIPDGILKHHARSQEPLAPQSLPFALRIREYHINSDLTDRAEGDRPSAATDGAGMNLTLHPQPFSGDDDNPNVPAAFVEVLQGGTSMGVWLVSSMLRRPASFEVNGLRYEMNLRPLRFYLDYTLTLLDFTHEKYPGTELPSNFSSLVRLRNPTTQEDREVLIYMNNPLRYEGRTFYQASFGKGDTMSVLQVVENPGWLTPYVACSLIALGLAVQFLSHLVAFSRKQAA